MGMWLRLLVFFPLLAFGGQSLIISTAQVTNSSVSAQGPTSACRMEWSLHDWGTNPTNLAHPVDVNACGLDVQFITLSGEDVRIQIYQRQSGGASYGVCQIPLNRLSVRFVNVRYQHVPGAPATSGLDTCEAWDIAGRRFFFDSKSYSSVNGNAGKGVKVTGAGTLSMGYLRLFTTTVPMGSRPPVTADTGDLLEWKFDGNLNDASSHFYSGTVSDGSVTYLPTPGQDLVVASIRTANAPPWSDWVPMRVGFPNEMDCSESYSQADQSATVGCEWMVTGPSLASLSNPVSAKPTVFGISSFGTYTFQLKVTDATGRTTTKESAVGAVAYDDNGVVTPSDPAVSKIFGPMIALGKNPWGYADERAKRMVELQHDYFLSQGLKEPVWATPGQGTVSYIFAGIGPDQSIPGTTLYVDISAQQQTFFVTDAGKLPGLASLPTWIFIGNAWGSQELVRICSTSALYGPAQLTACYDGRGLSGIRVDSVQTISRPWPAGTLVGEYRIQGSGTRFVSDPNRPMCPGGAPGPPGPVVYSNGTALLSGGSNLINGQDTTWTTANGVAANRFIRVEATHAGQPFVYWSRIASVQSPNQLTVDRPLPIDLDPGSYAYKIISYRFVSLEFTAPDGALQNTLQSTQGCESEDAMFAMPIRDITVLNHKTMSGMHYSYKDGLGIQSAFGPNFYGSGMAARALYFRSGWDFAKQTADIIDEYWVRDPEIAAGWSGGIPLLQGGAVIGAIADLVTNPDTKLRWNDVRAFALNGAANASASCSAFDTRDSGYTGAWLTLAANFDPDSEQQQKWQEAMVRLHARDVLCQQQDHSWANGSLFSRSNSPKLTVTPGSDVVRGVDLSPDLCFGTSRGQIEVTNGSAVIRGSGLTSGAKIVLSGMRAGESFVGTYQFTQSNGVDGLLSALWQGDSGTADFIFESSDFFTTIATDNEDPQLSKNWACTYVSPQELRLNRAWDGPATSEAHIFSYSLAGFGQQPYMLGIKITAMGWAAQNRDLTIANSYREFMGLAGQWIHDVGYDPTTQGLYYGRVYAACEPATVATPESKFFYRTPSCGFGLNSFAIRAARTLTAEATSALGAYFTANPTPDRQAWGDVAYGSIWGYCPYTKPGFYCDENYVRDENSDVALSGYKWPGFFFGMGMAHQWPAVRQTVRNRRR